MTWKECRLNIVNIAVENGYDRVRGIYQTILGKIFIVTDSERYATTIYSEKEYLKEINY